MEIFIQLSEFFNFNESFLRWVVTLYSNASTCFCNNEFSLAFFQISRGVRQGCPLDPYIFIICAESLAILINNSSIIRGITILDREIKILQFADDTTVFVDGAFQSLIEIVNVFHSLEMSSGLRVNYDKTNPFSLNR